MSFTINAMEPQEAYTRFLDLRTAYSDRNARMEDLSTFFEGIQWEELEEVGESPEDAEVAEREEVRLVLNYARRAALYHVALMTGKFPRIDVQTVSTKPDVPAQRREHYLRASTGSVEFQRAYQAVEINAAKLGYGVLQIIWDPPEGQPISKEVHRAEGSQASTTQKVYTEVPFRFRSIPPTQFYPCYRTYDHPNDLMYAIRYEPSRLIEDLQQKYKVTLQATGDEPGTAGTCELVEFWDDARYILLAVTKKMTDKGEYEKTPHVLVDKQHNYGFIPFIVLPNIWSDPNEDPTDTGCLSEVAAVMDSNVHLNLIMSLSAEEIATRIHPPTAYKTDNPQQDPHNIRMGAGEVIPIGVDEDLVPLDWRGVPQSVAEHRNATMQAMRDFSGMPRTSLGGGDQAQSGIGMRLAYTALEMILPLKLPLRVDFLRTTCRRMLQLTEAFIGDTTVSLVYDEKDTGVVRRLRKEDIGDSFTCTVRYGNLIPRDEVQHEQHVVYLFKTSTISHQTALELLDFIEDPAAELERIKQENQDPVLHPEMAAMIQKAQGRPEQQQGPPGLGAPGPQQGMPPGPPGAEGLKFNAAPPVPTLPSMPTQQNAPYLQRGLPPNFGQMMPGGPGVNQGPPLEGQM